MTNLKNGSLVYKPNGLFKQGQNHFFPCRLDQGLWMKFLKKCRENERNPTKQVRQLIKVAIEVEQYDQ